MEPVASIEKLTEILRKLVIIHTNDYRNGLFEFKQEYFSESVSGFSAVVAWSVSICNRNCSSGYSFTTRNGRYNKDQYPASITLEIALLNAIKEIKENMNAEIQRKTKNYEEEVNKAARKVSEMEEILRDIK